MMKKGIIYKATNIINGKSYIGQTTNFVVRKSYHKRLKGQCWVFYRAIKKYGFNNFKWEIIEEDIDEDELDEKEIYYIAKFGTYVGDGGYNLTHGGRRNFGASGEYHYLNLMSEAEKCEWLKNHRLGENNPNFGNGQSISGNNHFLSKMTDGERDKWLNDNLRGRNNYQKKLSKVELREKCWINHLNEEEKKKWIEKLSGDNNPFRKAYLKNLNSNSYYYGAASAEMLYYLGVIALDEGKKSDAILYYIELKSVYTYEEKDSKYKALLYEAITKTED